MTSYIPEHYYGLVPGSYREPGGERYGLIPWPAHMKPRDMPTAPLPDIDLRALFGETPAVELTKKGEAYAEAAQGEVFFLAITPKDRTSIAYTIESLINLLDAMDGDADVEFNGDEADGTPLDECEPDCDDEHTLGWEKGSMPYDQTYLGMHFTDEAEEVSEDEGADTGDDEYSLGWSEEGSQVGNLTAGSYGMEGELEPELGTTEEIDQLRRLEMSTGWIADGSEPDLGWAESFGRGIIGEQNCLDDREHEDEREHDPAEHGLADDDAMKSEEFCFNQPSAFHGGAYQGGGIDFRGDGAREAKALLRKARTRQAERPSTPRNVINLRNFAPTDDDILSMDLLAHYRAAHGQLPC